MSGVESIKSVKRSFWGVAAFYFLIAFEFLYMASPFAIYFYSVYRPVLNLLNRFPVLSGLVSYFMPHFSKTSSFIINIHNIVGAVLAILGFVWFCVGACQVYYHKLARKGAVTGGVYKFIRHPQYAAFIICSFGLLVLWPRYIVLIMFSTMLFAYYLLARAEEKECEAKFGQSYIDYKNRTGMFFPFKIPFLSKLKITAKSRGRRILIMLGLYVLTLTAGIGIATGFNYLTLSSLYTNYTDVSVFLSVSEIESTKLETVKHIVLEDKKVEARLKEYGIGADTRYLNYVLPQEWNVPEVPMNIKPGTAPHSSPSDFDRDRYKVVFTIVEARDGDALSGQQIITDSVKRTPILEVWVDTKQGNVTELLEIPEKVMYENIPVAIF